MKHIKQNKYIVKYFLLTFALIISAISYNLFLRPMHVVTGGTSGIAIILEYLFEIDTSFTIFIMDLFFLILCFIFLGKKETLAVLYITILYPILVSSFSFLTNTVIITNANILLASIYAGILSGISSGLIYKANVNTGGTGVITKIIYKYRKISMSKINLIISFIIILAGTCIFGIDMLLYAVVVIIITRIISERILLGASRNKSMFIVTEKYEKICDFLNEELKHDTTIYKVNGRYSSVNSKMIMVIIPTSEYFIIKESIKSIDKSAFVFVSDSYESRKQDIKIKSENN